MEFQIGQILDLSEANQCGLLSCDPTNEAIIIDIETLSRFEDTDPEKVNLIVEYVRDGMKQKFYFDANGKIAKLARIK
jgi:hypothetical protein